MYRFLGCLEFPGTGIFHESRVFHSPPVNGWMTALAWCRCDQWLFTRAMAMWAESIH
jgi:hypothetical protein